MIGTPSFIISSLPFLLLIQYYSLSCFIPIQSNFPWLGSNVRDNDEMRGLFHATKDIDTFDVSIPSGSGGNGSNGNEGGNDSGLDRVKVGVFGVCTQHTPSLADPGDKVVLVVFDVV